MALAGQLSDTVQRERATARQLAEYLATRQPQEHLPAARIAPRPSGGLRLTCTACQVTVHAPVDDVDDTVQRAHAFFSEHDRCPCEIDLTDPSVERVHRGRVVR